MKQDGLPRRVIDMRGKKIGPWIVKSYAGSAERGGQHARWRCECACGAVAVFTGIRLRRYDVPHCSGCQKPAQIWRHIIKRQGKKAARQAGS